METARRTGFGHTAIKKKKNKLISYELRSLNSPDSQNVLQNDVESGCALRLAAAAMPEVIDVLGACAD